MGEGRGVNDSIVSPNATWVQVSLAAVTCVVQQAYTLL